VRHGLEYHAHVRAHALGRAQHVPGRVRVQRQAAVERNQLADVGGAAERVEAARQHPPSAVLASSRRTRAAWSSVQSSDPSRAGSRPRLRARPSSARAAAWARVATPRRWRGTGAGRWQRPARGRRRWRASRRHRAAAAREPGAQQFTRAHAVLAERRRLPHRTRAQSSRSRTSSPRRGPRGAAPGLRGDEQRTVTRAWS